MLTATSMSLKMNFILIFSEVSKLALFIICCRRPTSLQDRGRDSDDEDFRDRDYDVATLASNLSQAFKYGIYSNDDIEEVNAWMLTNDLHSGTRYDVSVCTVTS